MYLFFMISGFFFVVGAEMVIINIFDLFDINKITTFLNPNSNSVFNKISIGIIPITLWSIIELIVLGTNKFFLLGFLLNIFLSLSITYVIKYGYLLVSNIESYIVDLISILISCFFGFLCNYLCLIVAGNSTINIFISIFGIILFIILFLYIKFRPPKTQFFIGSIE